MLDATVGPFQLDAPLGTGAMGSVWRAVHRQTGAPVAIKVIAKSETESAQGTLERELRAVAAMRHVGIVAVLDYGQLDTAAAACVGSPAGSPWLAMELAELGSLLDTPPRGLWSEVRDLLDQLLAALAHAHARRVIHRDLKPANVLVFPAGGSRRYAIADFGVAFAMDRDHATHAGTPRFMAPEQFAKRWRDQGPWTDLYSLGCMTWELVTGTPLYRAKSITEFGNAHRYLEPGDFVPQVAVPAGFEAWLRSLLVKGIGGRVGHAAVARSQLRELGDAPQSGERAYTVPATVASASAETLPTLTSRTTGLMTFFLEDEEPQASIPRAPSRVSEPTVFEIAERAPNTLHARSTDRRLFDVGLGLLGIQEPPLAGRGSERAALWAALRDVCRGREHRTFFIEGPSGYGRTRLAKWFTVSASEYTPVRALFIDHVLGNPPGRGLANALVQYFRLADLSTADAAKRLEALDVPNPGLLAATLDGHVCSPNIWLALLRSLQTSVPLVLVFDDPDRDPLSLKLVEELNRARDLRILLVVTGAFESPRARNLRKVLEHHDAEILSLRPLDDFEMRTLLVDHLGLHEGVIVHLAERSGGSPAIAVQTLIDWAEAGALVAGKTSITLAGPPPPHAPTDAWSRRAIRLHTMIASGARRALELAAILGITTSDDRWSALAAARGVSTDDLGIAHASVASRGLMRRSESGEWSFVDARVRHALLGRIDRTTSRQDHAEAAGIAAALGDRSAQGRHLYAAEQYEEAADVLLNAAERQLHTMPYVSESLLLLELAEQALESLQVTPDDTRQGLLAVLRTRTYTDAGLHMEALEIVDNLLATARTHGVGWSIHQSRGLYMKGMILQTLGRDEEAVALLLDALDSPATPTVHGLATKIHLGLVEAYLGQMDLDRADQEIRALEKLPDLDRMTRVVLCNGRAEVARHRGNLEAARSGYDEALCLLEDERGHYHRITSLNLALVSLLDDMVDHALEILNRLYDEAALTKSPLAHAAVVTLMQEAYARSGRWGDWDRRLAEQELLLGEALNEHDTAQSLSRQVRLARSAGHDARAEILQSMIRRIDIAPPHP